MTTAGNTLQPGSGFLTSYDLLKVGAVLLFIIDHLGYFFLPDQPWLRICGRMAVPVWFFLVGYASTPDENRKLLIGGGLIVLADFAFGGPLLPLNLLISTFVAKILLDIAVSLTFRNWETTIYGTFVISILTIATFFFMEQGLLGLLIAMAGFVARQGDALKLTLRARRIFMGYVVAYYALYQMLVLGFSENQSQVMVIGIGLSAILLYFFVPREVPEVEDRLPLPAVSGVKLASRYAVEIYAAHMILIKLAACLIGLTGYGWFHWDWFR